MPRSPAARRARLLLAALAVAPATLAAQHEGHGAARPDGAAGDAGRVVFPTSARPEAHAHFLRGVALLHNFLYADAAQAFRRARALDSADVMSAAFEALTHTHPVWSEQDTAAARAALRSLAPTRAARLAMARAPREREWLDAVETLYDGDTPKAVRDTAFSRAMAALHAADPRDAEAATFYALALLGLNQGEREPGAYAQAEAIVDTVLRAHPRHPGALHYKIHAVDDPANAARGLAAARAYGGVAPGAHHALHMTSHIYMARGMWDDVVASNRRAVALAPRFSAHYMSWLVYGLVQQGRPREARAWVDSMLVVAGEAGRPPAFRAMLTSSFPALWVVNAEAWDDPLARLRPDTARLSAEMRVHGVFFPAYAAARRAARPDGGAGSAADRAFADSALAFLTARAAALRARPDGRARNAAEQAAVKAEILRAELLAGAGRTDSAVAVLRAAAARWEALPFEFGPPEPVVVPRERAAQLLLSLGRPAEALAQADSAERMTPGRTGLLLARARALAALGRQDEARRSYAALDSIWHAAEPDFAGRRAARAAGRED